MASKVIGVPLVASRLRAYDAGARKAFRAGAAMGAERVTQWERSNHRWQNQTGNAEQGLSCTMDDRGDRLRLVNVHGVPYGIFLETMQQGRFAILFEAIRRYWPSTCADMARRAKAVR